MNLLRAFLMMVFGLSVMQSIFSMEKEEKKKRKRTTTSQQQSKKSKWVSDSEDDDSLGKSEKSAEDSLDTFDIAPTFVLACELSPNPPDLSIIDGESLLYSAVKKGNLTSVISLLEHRVNPNAGIKKHKISALHRAVAQGNEQIIKVLLLWGADPRLQAVNGRSPFYYAVLHNKKEVVSLLLTFPQSYVRQDRLQYLCKRFPIFNKQVMIFLMALKRISRFVPKPLLKIISFESFDCTSDNTDYCCNVWFGSNPVAMIKEMVNKEDDDQTKPYDLPNIDPEIIELLEPYVEKNEDK